MPQYAQQQGASDAIFGCAIRRHLVKLHVCKVCTAFEYLEVIRYPMTATHSNMNVFHQFILSKMQNSVAVLAEIPLRSPQKIFIFIINFFFVGQSIQK